MRPSLLVPLTLLALPALLSACGTTRASRNPDTSRVALTRARPVRAWELWEEGKLLGLLVRFEEAGTTIRAFYSVRNREGQELGLVDLEGRAWRHRPHEAEPEWLGSGTVIEGARRILDGHDTSELIEVDLDRLRDVLERSR
jgi:hypothetical protein